MMARSRPKAKKTSRGRGKGARSASTEDQELRRAAAADVSAFKLSDDEVEAALSSGKHSGLLEDYFGADEYREMRKIAQEASARKVRGGPRVLIVPGIMGSKIGRERTLLDDILWIDPVDVALGRLSRLRLNGGDSSLRALGVILFAYLKLKLSLVSAGYDASFYPYDWRQSLARLGRELAETVNRDKAERVHIVAHSMGGLVARAAIARDGKKFGRVVMLGTPNHGSFVPVQVLRAVYPVVRKIAFVDVKHSVEELVNRVFRTFPSLYEMMPWPEKFALLDLFDKAVWPADGPRPVGKLLRSARGVQQSLAPADERFFLIAGVNRETTVGLRKEGEEFVYDLSQEGDGTVPLAMAELPGAKTYFIEETHGSLPNNSLAARAVEDILAAGETSALPDTWKPSRAGMTRALRDGEMKEVIYEGPRGRLLSLREQRQLIDELVSGTAAETAVPEAAAVPALPLPGEGHEFQRVVIGRRHQHQLEIRLALGSITDVDARAYVLGMFREVTPSGAASAIDALVDGAIGEFITRRMFTGNVGEISIIPTGRHPIRSDMIAFAGLGAFDKMTSDVLELVAENLVRTFLKTRVDDFATVLFGGSSGQDPTKALGHLLKGFFRGLLDADVNHRFHGITFCETNRERYDAIKREIYRLSSTPLFDQIEVTIDEVQLPPMVETRVYGVRPPVRREPLYLIVRCERSGADSMVFEASLLTAGSKATVIKGKKEVEEKKLRAHLDKIRENAFTIDRLSDFGRNLAGLVIPDDITSVLERFTDNHLVVVHDAYASRVPWETISINNAFPAAAGGMSRRYLADNLSVAKWMDQRKYGPILDVLLVVNPTEDLPGAELEGKRIRDLFGSHTSSVRLKVLQGGQARKSVLLSHFASGEYDVIHYAGHAFFNSQNPAGSGILCSGREVLSGADLAGVGNLPGLMFFNACEAGRIRKPREKDAHDRAVGKRIERNVGLAEAFLRGGIANYLGTYWPVGDDPAKRFAEVFYSDLLTGRAIGDALLNARKQLQESRWVDWADYILYGSADFVLKVPQA